MSRSRQLIAALFSAALVAGVAGAATASTVVSGFDSNSLAPNDDGSSGSVTLPFTVNFFGVSRDSLFVNNNGNVTFNAAQSAYTPFGLGAGYTGQPIIAAFFADVDTRGSGSVTYGNGSYAGHTAFGVDYTDVGYYNSHSDLKNTFQMILTDRSDLGAGDFDIYFNYDDINWETGDASDGSGGKGGVSAAAGFSNGTADAGTFFQLPGSLQNGAFLNGGPNALVSSTNDGVDGQFLFQVRNGQVIIPPIGGVPEPATWAMMLLGFGGVGAVVRRRRAAPRSMAAFTA
jgi:hypothetical protein